jgi:hypothetical protein
MNILLPENSLFRINSSKMDLNQRASGLGYIHDIPIVVLYRSPKTSLRVSDNNRKVTCQFLPPQPDVRCLCLSIWGKILVQMPESVCKGANIDKTRIWIQRL